MKKYDISDNLVMAMGNSLYSIGSSLVDSNREKSFLYRPLPLLVLLNEHSSYLHTSFIPFSSPPQNRVIEY